MIWGYHEDNPWHDDESDPVAEKYHTILGFNEPNRSDQSDIDPETAAAAWIEIQEMYPDRILVSPAPAGGNTGWFDKFFQVLGTHSGKLKNGPFLSTSTVKF
jgi:hypothetical protein